MTPRRFCKILHYEEHPLPGGWNAQSRARAAPARVVYARKPAPALAMNNQVVTPEMARAIHADAVRGHMMFGWVVWAGNGRHQGKLVARLVTSSPSIYLLVAETLGELRAMLPPGLNRSERQPADPPDVIEMWW